MEIIKDSIMVRSGKGVLDEIINRKKFEERIFHNLLDFFSGAITTMTHMQQMGDTEGERAWPEYVSEGLMTYLVSTDQDKKAGQRVIIDELSVNKLFIAKLLVEYENYRWPETQENEDGSS